MYRRRSQSKLWFARPRAPHRCGGCLPAPPRSPPATHCTLLIVVRVFAQPHIVAALPALSIPLEAIEKALRVAWGPVAFSATLTGDHLEIRFSDPESASQVTRSVLIRREKVAWTAACAAILTRQLPTVCFC
jgi:hypothetical protein